MSEEYSWRVLPHLNIALALSEKIQHLKGFLCDANKQTSALLH